MKIFVDFIEKPRWHPDTLFWLVFLITIIFIVSVWVNCFAETALTASWYSVESCEREGTSGIMANGRKLNDEELTCASWDFRFGTKLKITNERNGKSVIVTVTDRGPTKRLYRQGRIVDLSKRAFSQIADLKQGIISVTVEEVK